MAKTETNVSTLKINRGTYDKVQENLSSITENELIITSDKNVPIPTTSDNGKAVVVNASGEYELGNVSGDYVLHTYSIKTYTSSDADYEQLREDITNHRDFIKQYGGVFHCVSAGTSSYLYQNIAGNDTNLQLYVETLSIVVSTNSVVISASTANTLTAPIVNYVASPSSSATSLTGLKIGSNVYKIETDYPIHSYTANTTYTGDDLTQLRDDITHFRMIKIGSDVYHCIYAQTNATYWYAQAYNVGSTIYMNKVTIGYDTGNVSYITYSEVTSGMTNPMTTQYDMIVAGANGVPTRIDGGSSDYNFKALIRTNSNPVFAVISPDKITASQQNAQYKVPYVLSNSVTSVFGLGKPASDFGLGYLTTAPSSDNTDGGLKMVVLTSEPATRYNGWWYLILSQSNG